MIWKKEGNIIYAKLEYEKDIFEELENLVKEAGIKNGMIISGIGAGYSMDIGYFKDGKYEREVYKNQMEITSFSGSISEDEPRFHIHINLARQDHTIIGGHLFGGKIRPLLELTILETGVAFGRKMNEKSNLKELYFK
ncbi:PPC domain-containing DNA-binding protein [Caldiplasma sukawensis]